MFRRFLDATDYWFGCSDDSSTGSYDPVRECCIVIANDLANATGAVGAGDGEVTPAQASHRTRLQGRASLLGLTLTRSWPKFASSRPSW
jgi:hypothetical protein